jgi:hypothetical protein
MTAEIKQPVFRWGDFSATKMRLSAQNKSQFSKVKTDVGYSENCTRNVAYRMGILLILQGWSSLKIRAQAATCGLERHCESEDHARRIAGVPGNGFRRGQAVRR